MVALVLLGLGSTHALHSMHQRGSQVIAAFVARASRQPVASLSLHRGYVDNEIIARSITPGPKWLRAVESFMRHHKHVPFHRDLPPLGRRTVDPAKMSPKPNREIRGSFQQIHPIPKNKVSRILGWAFHPDKEVREVLLLDRSGHARAELILGIHRGMVGKQLGAAALASGWEGYAELSWGREEAEIHVRLEGEDLYYPLPRSKALKDWIAARRAKKKR